MEQIKDKIDKCMILIMERFHKLENKLEKLHETNNIKDTDLLDDNEAQITIECQQTDTAKI